LNDGKFDPWLPSQPDLLSDSECGKPNWPIELETSFRMLGAINTWIGDRYGFPTDPRHPSATYPEVLYTQFKITKRVTA